MPDAVEVRAGSGAHAAGFSAVAVADVPGWRLAATAGRHALEQAGCGPREVDLLVHACSHDQDHLTPVSAVQRLLGAHPAAVLEVRRGSDSGMSALVVAADHLAARSGRNTALVTVGERFARPGFDRWKTVTGMVLGDAGASALLSRSGGFARLAGMGYSTAAELEECTRLAVLEAHEGRIDGLAAKRQLGLRVDLTAVGLLLAAHTRRAVAAALADADIDAGLLSWVAVPYLGERMVRAVLCEPSGILTERTTWWAGRSLGHAGGADQLHGLGALLAQGRVRPGQYGLLLGMGAGFSWTAVVLHIDSEPSASVHATRTE
ncbi:ketoacyl-ACP synthase III family protein [Streptomyces sp. FIT100]|uniref:ketoacyl-ACP synthase III family protein n=1 Tax=Streptomyces sp. FIT100 TaxID=2837956 RepID=UPI0021C900DE|nr:ketoacyl-ACP synthase III family protein [Streptomyces sp. FIT100]UUN30057.1 ketoacyl-ACP synthase III family protein [Streptomyces sp. FIT100]